MNIQLKSYFDLLERERINLISQVLPLPSDKLNHSPEGKWSINEIVAHLIASERLSLMYMQKKILGIAEAGNTGLWEEAKMLAIIISQRLPFKFKAPKVVKEHAPNSTSIQQLNQDWEKVRMELKTLLEKIPDDLVNRKIYRHVYAGKLNAKHAVRFLREHVMHHIPQIKRLM